MLLLGQQAGRVVVSIGPGDFTLVFVPDEERHADPKAIAVGWRILQVAFELHADRYVARALGAGQVAVRLGGGQAFLGGGQVGALVERRRIEGDLLQLRPVVGGNDLLGFAVAPDQVGQHLLRLGEVGLGLAGIGLGTGLVDLQARYIDRCKIAGLQAQTTGPRRFFVKRRRVAGQGQFFLGQAEVVVGLAQVAQLLACRIGAQQLGGIDPGFGTLDA